MIAWNRVNELRDEIGADCFVEVVTLFLEEADEVIAQLNDAPREDRFEADFHALKGSALNLGFEAFASICAEAERFAVEGRYHLIDIPKAAEAFNAARDALLAQMNEDSAA